MRRVIGSELRRGLEHHAARRLADAEAEYRKVLREDPRNSEAILLLGIVARQSGQPGKAVELLSLAAALRPETPHYYWNLGLACSDAGDTNAAVICYRRALKLDQGFTNAHLSLGDLLAAKEQWEEARICYRHAMASRPELALPYVRDGYLYCSQGLYRDAIDSYTQALSRASANRDLAAGILSNIGLCLTKVDQLDQALEVFRQAIARAPQMAEAHLYLADALYVKGHWEQAIASYQQSLRLNLIDARVYNNLGNALAEIGRRSQAIESYKAAVALKPDRAAVHRNLGNAYIAEEDFDAAEQCYRKAMILQPDSAESVNVWGNLLLQRHQLDSAEQAYRRAILLRPEYVEAVANLGTSLMRQRRPKEAAECYRRALELNPDCAGAHYNHSLACLIAGEYALGWREHEWRWKFKELGLRQQNFSEPLWRGEALQGERILLHAEQGFGDTIQFARYAPLVAERGGEVILQVQSPLRRLMEQLPGVAKVVVPGEPLPQFSWQCPLMSLPLAFGTTLDTIPNTPYLCAGASLPTAQRTALPGRESQFKVGLTWAGNPNHKNDRRRSLPLEILVRALAPLVAGGDLPNVSFFSLQKGSRAAEIGPFASELTIEDPCSMCQDFAETAALVAELDLVITVDTAIAHLAGALGKPVWVLLPYAPDWRWHLDRDDSPWYPSARLFRQISPGGWDNVAERIGQQLVNDRSGCLLSKTHDLRQPSN